MISQEVVYDESQIDTYDNISMFRCFLVDQFVPKQPLIKIEKEPSNDIVKDDENAS